MSIILSGFGGCTNEALRPLVSDNAAKRMDILFVDSYKTDLHKGLLDYPNVSCIYWGQLFTQIGVNALSFEPIWDRGRDIVHLTSADQDGSKGYDEIVEVGYLMLRRYGLWGLYSKDALMTLLSRLLSEIHQLFKNEKIDYILSYDIPHSAFDYLLLCGIQAATGCDLFYLRNTTRFPYLKTLHRMYGGKQGLTSPIPLNGFSQQSFEYFDTIYELTNAFKEMLKHEKENKTGRYSIYDESRANAYSHARDVNRKKISGNICSYANIVTEAATLLRHYRHVQTPSAKCNLKDAVIIYLHREPEATTLPEGLPLLTQLDYIRFIRSRFASEVEIYVKEHPDTFTDYDNWVWGNCSISRWRSHCFYDEICSMENTFILPLEESTPNALRSRPKAICTYHGSIYFEALEVQIPVIGHPSSPLSLFPGFISYDAKDIEQELAAARRLMSRLAKSDYAVLNKHFKRLKSYMIPLTLLNELGAEESSPIDLSAFRAVSSKSLLTLIASIYDLRILPSDN